MYYNKTIYIIKQLKFHFKLNSMKVIIISYVFKFKLNSQFILISFFILCTKFIKNNFIL